MGMGVFSRGRGSEDNVLELAVLYLIEKNNYLLKFLTTELLNSTHLFSTVSTDSY